LDPAASAAVEARVRPSSHILHLVVAAAGLLSERCCKAEGAASIVVPSTMEALVVVGLASLPTSQALAVGSRACNRICHHRNAFARENALSDYVIDVDGEISSGVCDILLPQEQPPHPRSAPCLFCFAGVCG
jgi:hypothetical protein